MISVWMKTIQQHSPVATDKTDQLHDTLTIGASNTSCIGSHMMLECPMLWPQPFQPQ